MYSETGMNEGGFLKPNIDTLVINAYGERVKWITNSKGFRNSLEFEYKKPPNTYRILSIGDSFTAGYRVGQTQTFSYLLEQKLNESQDSTHYEVIIACIEDPINGLKFLHEYGLKYEPDLVLLGITIGNDLTQTFIGLHEFGKNKLVGNKVIENENFDEQKLYNVLQERFPEDACDYSFELDDYFEKLVSLKLLRSLFNKEYQGESIFASRGKTNPYLHDLSHGLGLFLKEQPESIKETYDQFEKVLLAYKSLSEENSFKLIVSMFPQRYQINRLDSRATYRDYDMNEDYFHNGVALEYLFLISERAKINYFDLHNKLLGGYKCVLNKKTMPSENYYLPLGDMHWNAKGHALVSEEFFYYLSPNYSWENEISRSSKPKLKPIN
ncbi:MAG: SGNH/GDSL hydrolase family protein [Flavobacteriales bacterium]|nr:SGNH/GDSL hydrolase family protein [Flavobacteriales bacterium]